MEIFFHKGKYFSTLPNKTETDPCPIRKIGKGDKGHYSIMIAFTPTIEKSTKWG
jgi:hypothetical protein